MDRYDPARDPRVDSDPPHDAVGPVVAAAAIALALAALVLPRLGPAVDPVAAGLGWLPWGSASVAGGVVATATLASLVRGLRDGHLAEMLRAAAFGALTAALALAALRAGLEPAGFPDAGLALAAPPAAALVLAARLLPGVRLAERWSTPLWVAIFGVAEATLAGALLLDPAALVVPWLYAAAAAVLLLAIDRRRWVALALLAAGFAGLAVARVGSIDAVPAVVAVAAGALVAIPDGRQVARRAATERVESAAVGTAAEPAALDDATRLARELRGTIEELLHARRTVELQRDELARAATVDPLTGVATRRTILDRLRIEAAEARRYGHPVAVLLVDVDDFGQLNRDHGIAIGDDVLREVALRLRLRVRAADALGRIGGNTFLVLLPHTDEAGAARFADALRGRLLERPYETDAGELTVTLSIGIAFMRPGMELDDDELLAAADEALASARRAGGNRIAFDRLHGLVRLEERRPPDAGTG